MNRRPPPEPSASRLSYLRRQIDYERRQRESFQALGLLSGLTAAYAFNAVEISPGCYRTRPATSHR